MDIDKTSLIKMKCNIFSLVRRILYEVRLHSVRLKHPKRRPCVLICPSNQPWDAASNLRAWLVAPALEQLGWRAVVVPQPLSLSQRLRILRFEDPDVILLQQTRHPLNDPALYQDYPCVLDVDDADYLDPKNQQRIAKCASGSAAVIGGNRFLARCLGAHNPNAHVLWTCTPPPRHPPYSPDEQAPVVARAHGAPMRYPHEAEFIQQVMIEVFRRINCVFWLFGTSEAEAVEWFAPLRRNGGCCVAIPKMSYDAYLDKVAEAAVGLQPVSSKFDFSNGKSFGKVLAYLAGKVVVVASNAVDHPVFFRNGQSGILVDEVVDDWVEAIVDLISNPTKAQHIAEEAWHNFHNRLTTDVFARLLDPILRGAIDKFHRSS